MAKLLLRAESAHCNAAYAATPVNPATFLDYFTALGGGYWLTPDGKLWLGVLQTDANEPDRRLAAQLMRQIAPADAERIKAHLAGLVLPSDPVAEFIAAEQAHNAEQLDEDGYIEALHRLDDWQPPTERDFVRKFLALFDDGGGPTEERIAKLLANARNLCGRA